MGGLSGYRWLHLAKYFGTSRGFRGRGTCARTRWQGRRVGGRQDPGRILPALLLHGCARTFPSPENPG